MFLETSQTSDLARSLHVPVGDAPGSASTPGPPPYSAPSMASSQASFKEELISFLCILTHLTGTGEVSLQIAYHKYKAFLIAFIHTMR